MRILSINKFYWPKGGSERVMLDLNAGYEAEGHGVAPFAMASSRNLPTPWAGHFAPEVDWESTGLAGRLAAGANVLWSREAAKRLRNLVEEYRPDVAHLHNFHHQLSPSIVEELRRARIPAVHTMHDYKVVCPNYLLYTQGAPCERCAGGRFGQAVRRRCVRDSRSASALAALESAWHRRRRTLERGIAVFVSPSRFLAEKIRAMGFAGRDVRVVPNGVDPDDFRPAGEPGDGFLYAGRLSREKGVGTLIEAVGRRPEIRLTIAGAGPEEREARAAAERVAPGRIRFAGQLDATALRASVRRARAVVLPSEWYENAPMAALEAGAGAVPVIGARIGGIPELVRDGETGLLFEPGNAAELADRLAELEADPARAHELGRAARARIERELTRRRQIDTMLDLLREVTTSASR